jgi:hypothetical protein
MSPRRVSVDVGVMCYDVRMNTRVEQAVQHANRVHVAAREGWSVAHQREMSEQARARAHTERTSRYGKEPHHGEH